MATFRLTERPGPGTCGTGVGHTAQTEFVIKDGLIKEWRRVAIGGEQAPSSFGAERSLTGRTNRKPPGRRS